MTDRELLELAAQAAGIVVNRSRMHDPLQRDMLVANSARNQGQQNGPWNPLTDDGDALRLAVKLRLCVSIERRQASAMPPDQMSDDYFEAIEQVKSRDPYAATRRAIVRAAAEIGRTMP